MADNHLPADPAPQAPDVAERNVERLLEKAYRPEAPDPAFVQRVRDRMIAAAAGRIPRPRRLPILRHILSPLAAAAAVAALVYLTHTPNSKAPPDSIPQVAKQEAPAPRPENTNPTRQQEALPDPVGPDTPQPTAPPRGEGAMRSHLAAVLTPRERPAAPAVAKLAVGESLRTAGGERKRVALPDGSVLYLNQKTEVKLDAERRVTLSSGNVFVEVAPRSPDGGEPANFIVRTPEREVTALGTRFEVTASDTGTGVLVTQGKVRVSGLDGDLGAGQEVAPGALRPTAAPRAAAALAWTRELLCAAEAPLVPPSKYAGGALVVNDASGQPAELSLRKYHIDVHVEDGFARTTIDQTYFNHTQRRLEGTFHFPLPPDASLSRLAMYVNGQLMEGGMAERDFARQTFESIVRRMQDPALLEWVDGSTFKMRVFPLEPRQEKRIILSYTQRLPAQYGRTSYRFPAGHSLEAVRDWSFHARLKGGKGLTWASDTHPDLLAATIENDDLLIDAKQNNVKLDRDVALDLFDVGQTFLSASSHRQTGMSASSHRQTGMSAPLARFASMDHDGGRYLMVRYRPELPVAKDRKHRDWVFLFESSGDRDPLLARVQVEVIRTLLENAEHDDTFAIVTAATRAATFAKEARPVTPANVADAMRFLEGTHLAGVLDLGKGLAAAEPFLKAAKDPYLVHVGSGFSVLGETKADVLARRVPAEVRYVGVGVGKRWNRALMKAAAERSGGFFTQINPDEPVNWRSFELYSALTAPRLLGVKVVDDAEKLTFLSHTGAVAQGEEVCAVTRLEAGAPLPEKVTVTGTLDGKTFQRSLPVKDVAAGAGHLPRTWARLEIDRLLAENAQANKARIVQLSMASYVMTPFTSLLVLENDQMYEQFHVDRGRKDHWAMYACPESIPVVYEPLEGMPAAPKATPAVKPSAEDVLGTILVRIPPRAFGDGAAALPRAVTVRELYSGAVGVPTLDAPGVGMGRDAMFSDVQAFVETAASDLKTTTGTSSGGGSATGTGIKVPTGGSEVPVDPARMPSPPPVQPATPPVYSQPAVPGAPGGTPVSPPIQTANSPAPNYLQHPPPSFPPSLQGVGGPHQGMFLPGGGGGGRGGPGMMPPSGFAGGMPPGGLPGGGLGGGMMGMGGSLPGMGGNMTGMGGIDWVNYYKNHGYQITPGYATYPGLPMMSPGGFAGPQTASPYGPRINYAQLKKVLDEETRNQGTPGRGWREEAEKATRDLPVAEEIRRLARRLEVLRPQGAGAEAALPGSLRPEELLYRCPTFAADGRLFTDLVAFAPGLNTTHADVLGVLEAEAPPDPADAPGTIEPAARALVESARAAGWRTLIVPASGATPSWSISFDGSGRYAVERVLSSGLAEHVLCDGKELLHLYPELGLGARRSVTRFHRVELADLVPWALPPARDLAHGFDLKCVGERTVALVPHGLEAKKRAIVVHLVFAADGRLAERRLVETPKDRTLRRETYGEDGVVKVLDSEGKELSVRKLALKAGGAPDLDLDTRDLVVLPMPLRSYEYLNAQAAPAGGNLDMMDRALRLSFLATHEAAGNAAALQDVILSYFLNRGDNRPGFIALLLSSGQDVQAISPSLGGVGWRTPLGQRTSLALYVAWLKKGNPRVAMHPARGDGLLHRLAAVQVLLRDWKQEDPLAEETCARVVKYVRECQSPVFAWAVVQEVLRMPDKKVIAEGGRAKVQRDVLEAAVEALADVPALFYAARCELALHLAANGRRDEARKQLVALYEATVRSGTLPALDHRCRQVLQADGKEPDLFARLLRDTASGLAKDGRRVAVVALAWQCWELGAPALADELLSAALEGIPDKSRRVAPTLAALEYLWQTHQYERADKHLQELLGNEALARSAGLWRMGYQLALQRKQPARAFAFLAEALEREYRTGHDWIDVEAVRRDYGALLGHYAAVVRATATLGQKPPAGLAAKVVRAADRWRALDADGAAACAPAFESLRGLAEPDLAWDYLLMSARPESEGFSWANLAQSLAAGEDFDLAERAYAQACLAAPADAGLLRARADNLLRDGRPDAARDVLQGIGDLPLPAPAPPQKTR